MFFPHKNSLLELGYIIYILMLQDTDEHSLHQMQPKFLTKSFVPKMWEYLNNEERGVMAMERFVLFSNN